MVDVIHCQSLTIFEGPDGAGKSTAAQHFAKLTNAKYVHFGPLPQVGKNLARMYVEAMLPALLGYQAVVFDRSWLSEVPYGNAFREGADRLGVASRRMLERLAFRCGAVVVLCLPPWNTVKANYMKRKHLEMLENEDQLDIVFNLYAAQHTSLPVYAYDYTRKPTFDRTEVLRRRSKRHLLHSASAGRWGAKIAIVGEQFAERKDTDAFYQWPFASFNGTGCSQWLTNQLEEDSIYESELFWINADQDLSVLHDLGASKVIALGEKAAEALYREKIQAQLAPHPQFWKRFHNSERYPLLDLL